jgi:hypothetical protein
MLVVAMGTSCLRDPPDGGLMHRCHDLRHVLRAAERFNQDITLARLSSDGWSASTRTHYYAS